MNMSITENQFEVLCCIERAQQSKLTQRMIATETSFSLGMVNRVLGQLEEAGLITMGVDKKPSITQKGLEALEPYRVKRAVIMAAGFGSRMVPITLNTPKPLVRVHGKMIIETLLDAIVQAGIEEIVLVRGYLWEQFDMLLHKYPNIRFLYNPLFNEANNISSVYQARELLQNAYIFEADLLLSNEKLVRKYEYKTHYVGMYKDVVDDWCLLVKKGQVSGVSIGGTNNYQMYGISYWDAEDGKKLSDRIDRAFHMPGGRELYWDEVPLKLFVHDFTIGIRPCYEGDIIEIDTFNELKQVDPVYNM